VTPIEIAAAGPLEVPESYFAEGQVGAGSRAGDVPLLHRPHAFALTHGGLGAKVAYGELHIRVDSLTFDFQEYNMGAADNIIRCDGIGRKDIEKLTPIVPTVESGGDPMNPDNPSIYHQLDGYGSIYLNWTVNLGAFAEGSPENVVTSCYVSSEAVDSAVAALSAGHADSDRLGSGTTSGSYSVKLGEVSEDNSIKQHISSDVFWSFFVVGRDEKSPVITQSNMTC
tara:strand:+ start:682 stop:1359 length:678 start_codon:yes stop_codon:yes gene_type:complete